MKKSLGRGVLQSLRARVNKDVRDLVRENPALRSARHGLGRRLLRNLVVGRSVLWIVGVYVLSLAVALALEWVGLNFFPSWLLQVPDASSAVQNAPAVFVTAQVGILAVLTVAISVVTLLVQKDDGSSFNTDVRLYYVESYAYEVATSGVVLLGTTAMQLFWPIQGITALIISSADGIEYRLVVTAIHAFWLVFNFGLFLHFLRTTFEFVVPDSRAQLRKKYVATEIIPDDVARRLLALYYAIAPEHALGKQEIEAGPRITFGVRLFVADEVSVEISRQFRAQNHLWDVWLLPVGWALSSWQKRTRKKQGQPDRRFGRAAWSGHLDFPPDFSTDLEGPSDIVVREGAIPLRGWERALIFLGLRFRRIGKRQKSLPSPTEFIEQLISQVVAEIDKGAPNGFDDALKETIDFHRFILEAQNTRDEQGNTVNLAEVGDGPFLRPYAEWAREYRRAYVAAVNKMTYDPWFIRGLASVPVGLWPREPRNFPASVLQMILELGRYQVVTFENWVTKRAVIDPKDDEQASRLAGSDLRAYEEALISFVSSWESLETVIKSSFAPRRAAPGGRSDDEKVWDAAAASWPSLQIHMRNAAYFLASAVWNEDEPGADQFRDLFLRWLNHFYEELRNEFPFRDGLMLTPDVMRLDWENARAAAVRTLLYPQAAFRSRDVFGVILRQAHCDAVAIASAIFLNWYATKQQPSWLAANTGALTLRREARADGGQDLIAQGAAGAKSVFRLVFDLLIRRDLRVDSGEASYQSYLEGFIQTISEMASPRMIPGRIYGGFRLEGFRTLTPEFLAILTATLPERGDEGVSELMARLLEHHAAFQVDRTFEGFLYSLKLYTDDLSSEVDERFQATVNVLNEGADLVDRRARLKAIFEKLTSMIKSVQLERKRTAPLDSDRLALVRKAVTESLLTSSQPVAAFHSVSVIETDRTDIAVREGSFRELDRGSFTKPEMSGVTFDDLPGFFVENANLLLQSIIWWELFRRPKEVENVPPDAGIHGFFERALAAAAELGTDGQLVLLVPSGPYGNAVYMTASGFPDAALEGFAIRRDEAIDRGVGGALYVGTLNGIHIFSWNYNDAAVLCSRRFIRGIAFGRVRNTTGIYDFELSDDGDPSKSKIHFWIAPAIEWSDEPVTEFRFAGPQTEGEASEG